jgi:hypothetical protein
MPPWGSDCSFYPPDDQFPLASDYDYEDLIDSGGTTELSGALVGDGAWWEMLLVYIGVPLSVVLAAMALTLACFCVVTVKLDRLRDRFNVWFLQFFLKCF